MAPRTRRQRREIARAVELLSRRQRVDGGIGYWSPNDWSSVWLSSYAGIVLLDAREVGVAVDSMVLNRLAAFVASELRGESKPTFSPVASYWDRQEMRLRERVAAVDFLSRLRRPEVASENELLRSAAMLTLEDRARLAEVLARRSQMTAARQLMAATWAQVRVEGSRAVVPDSAISAFYFQSVIRPIARILSATLAVDPEHALVGPLAETLAQQGRAEGRTWMWNTQDYASAVSALAALERRRREQGERTVRVRSGNRLVVQASTGTSGSGRDSTMSLTGLLPNGGGAPVLRLSLDAGEGQGPVYYYMTVTEVPVGSSGDAGGQRDSRRAVVRALRRRRADHACGGGGARARAAAHHGSVDTSVRRGGRRAAGRSRGGGSEPAHRVGDAGARRRRARDAGAGRAGG